MHPLTSLTMRLALGLALVASSDAFFLKWGSDTSRQAIAQKQWIQAPNISPYRYQYTYNPYEQRKMYPLQPSAYSQAELYQPVQAPIPISVPAGAALTPVSLQHVQLVPCMCPVAPEEADKLHDQLGPGPYLAQTYPPPQQPAQSAYPTPNTDVSNNNVKQ